MSAFSVSSRHTAFGSTPVSARMRATVLASVGSASWRGERFTFIASMPRAASRGRARPASARVCRHAVSSTHAPIGTISPVSSASGMKSAGGTSPRSGWFHRTSASNPITRPVRRVDDRLVVHDELVALERAVQIGAGPQRARPPIRARRARTPRPGPGRRSWRGTSRRRRGAAASPTCRPPSRPRSRCSRSRTLLRSSSVIGSATASSRRRAIAEAASSPARSAHSTTNSSPPKRAITLPGRSVLAEPLGDRDHELVADRVPEAVVHDLEVVEVDEQHRDRAVA